MVPRIASKTNTFNQSDIYVGIITNPLVPRKTSLGKFTNFEGQDKDFSEIHKIRNSVKLGLFKEY